MAQGNCPTCGAAKNCHNPPSTLTIDDSAAGITGVTVNQINATTWTGSRTISYGACALGGCPASSVTINYTVRMDSTFCTITASHKTKSSAPFCPTDTEPTYVDDCTQAALVSTQCTPSIVRVSTATCILSDWLYCNVLHQTTLTVNGAAATTVCCTVWTIKGCNSKVFPGAVLNVWTDSGKSTQILTNTANGSGVVFADLGDYSGSIYYEVSGARFTAASNTITLTCTGTVLPTLSAASGYHCTGATLNCLYPEPDTMYSTHPLFGAITYTYSGGNWIGTVNYSYPGLSGCAAKTVTITCTWNGDTTYTESWKADGSNCPDNAGGSTITATWTVGITTCYVPSVSSFIANFTLTPSAGALQNLYGGSALALAITE